MSDPFTTSRLRPTRIVWQAAGSSTPEGCAYSLPGDSGGLILDFGRELFGGIEITVNRLVGGAEATAIAIISSNNAATSTASS